MAASPVDAISKAVERSKQLLFPAKAEKWFALGFTVFMAQCSEGGGGGGGSFNVPTSFPKGPTGSGGGGGGPSLGTEFQQMLDEALRALKADLSLYLLLGATIALVAIGLWLFVAWFSSRAKLMFVESVVWDRVDLSAQWGRAAALGMSLFKFRLVLSLFVWVLGLGAIAGAALVALPDWQAGQFFGTRAVAGYAIFTASTLFVALPLWLVSGLLEDFVVPLMVLRNVRVREAWAICRAEVLAGNVGRIVVFYLLRIALAIGVGIVVGVLSCLTCCLTTIPYIGTVLLLPISVFYRAYPLYFLEQVGVQVFPLPEPSWAAYDRWRFPT